MTLHNNLLKEKNNVVWCHGQAKRWIEQLGAELMDSTDKAMKDLQRELRHVGGLCTLVIKEEL